MQVGVSIEGHVEVEDDVDLLNIDTTAEKLSSNQNSVSELLEAFVDFQSKF